MSNVYQIMMDKFREGNGVEGNQGIYDRVQKLKQLLAQEVTDNSKDIKNNNDKILLVAHSRVL